MFGNKNKISKNIVHVLENACEDQEIDKIKKVLSDYNDKIARCFLDASDFKDLLEFYHEQIDICLKSVLYKAYENMDDKNKKINLINIIRDEFIPKQEKQLERIRKVFENILNDTRALEVKA